jgi:SpoVK/Ycf46/Vps4 family AAA+-type ATPase
MKYIFRVCFVISCIIVLYLITFNDLTKYRSTIIHNEKCIHVNSYEHTIYNSCMMKVSNEDVAIQFIGHNHVMKELEIIKQVLKDPSIQLKLPNTILLHGPPGTGKTTIAKQLSKQLDSDDMVLLCISMSNIENKYYGESLKLLYAVFSLAHKLEKCILFFDEIDGFMTERSSLEQTHSTTLKTTMLTCIDNVIGNNQIFVIAATNRPDSLDSAFLRRMELHMGLDKPTIEDKLVLGKKQFPQINHELVSTLFGDWTLHDINKFFRFVERRKWVDNHLLIDNETIYNYYDIYSNNYLLKKMV